MHSAERTFNEQNVRNPRRVRCECTADVAKIIGIAVLPSPDAISVRTKWPAPERTASSASLRIRSSASRNAFSPTLGSKVQSIDTISALKFSIRTSHWALPTKGLSKTKISVCALLSSSTFFRLPKRVFNDITRYSRKLSIGGFVTCEKF